MRLEAEGINPRNGILNHKYYDVSVIAGPDDVWAVIARWGKLPPRWIPDKEMVEHREIKATGDFETCSKEYNRLINKRLKNFYTKVE